MIPVCCWLGLEGRGSCFPVWPQRYVGVWGAGVVRFFALVGEGVRAGSLQTSRWVLGKLLSLVLWMGQSQAWARPQAEPCALARPSSQTLMGHQLPAAFLQARETHLLENLCEKLQKCWYLLYPPLWLHCGLVSFLVIFFLGWLSFPCLDLWLWLQVLISFLLWGSSTSADWAFADHILCPALVWDHPLCSACAGTSLRDYVDHQCKFKSSFWKALRS